MHDNDGISSH
ncbi:hypothetical protein YPPY63_1475, partial [Yersinia pestis PY-63]